MPYSITEPFVRKLANKPPPKPRDFRCGQLTGFLIRVQPTGRVSFYAQIRRGSRKKLGSHPTLSVATRAHGRRRGWNVRTPQSSQRRVHGPHHF